MLHQGDPTDLRRLWSGVYSAARRAAHEPHHRSRTSGVDGRFLGAGLIHRTREGMAVRSKSEVIIAGSALCQGDPFPYEGPLVAADGYGAGPTSPSRTTRRGRPSTGSTSAASAALLSAEMERKASLVSDPGVLPYAEGGGPAGVLPVSAEGYISSAVIEARGGPSRLGRTAGTLACGPPAIISNSTES